MIIQRFVIVCLLMFLTACSQEDSVMQTKFYAFGTEIDVSLQGVTTDKANATIAALERTFSDVDETWHAWRPSVLSDINQAISTHHAIPVSEDVAALIELAQTLAIQSEHLFNPAAGQLFALWGFHQDDWFTPRPPPPQADIDQWLSHAPKMTDLTITSGELRSHNAYLKLGFGGFAKGYAIDKAIAVLQAEDIANALVNIGGDLRAIGQAGERPWVIGIRHPRQDGMIATLHVSGDESVFTSGDYERFFNYQNTRYPHILDPRTGYPANEAISVTVLHDNASVADAAATALFVAGHDWPRIAAKMGVSHVMLIRPDGVIELSPEMKQRIMLLSADEQTVIRSLPH